MKDNIFKKLPHLADGYRILYTGQEIDKGYKPDVVLYNGQEYIIMECDTGTTRKGYLGGMVKAAKYLSGDRNGIAILVIKEKSNTTVDQIHWHLMPYFHWILPLTNLKAAYLINIDCYCTDNIPLKLLTQKFLSHARVLERTDR